MYYLGILHINKLNNTCMLVISTKFRIGGRVKESNLKKVQGTWIRNALFFIFTYFEQIKVPCLKKRIWYDECCGRVIKSPVSTKIFMNGMISYLRLASK